MEKYTYRNIALAGTYVIKTGSGVLHSIVNHGTTAASGTKIATFMASVLAGTFLYDLDFTNGLTVVTAGANDVTVTYS